MSVWEFIIEIRIQINVENVFINTVFVYRMVFICMIID